MQLHKANTLSTKQVPASTLAVHLHFQQHHRLFRCAHFG